MSLKRATLLALTLAVAAPAGSAFASDDPVLNDEIAGKIRAMLTEEGYTVGKIKTEDGFYEAYARKDGEKVEFILDRELNVVRKEIDD